MMMLRFFTAVIWLFCAALPFEMRANSSLNVSLVSEAAILINAETGVVLYEKNSHDQYFPASTTKVATALYTLTIQGDHLDVPVTVEQDAIASITPQAKQKANYTLPSHWIESDSTHIGLKKGEVVSLKDLLYGVLLASGNDASNAVAQYMGGTIGNFIDELNHFLKELGCSNTHFCNAHGLHHPNHVTTPHDMALIAREALKNPIFSEIVKTVRHVKPKTNRQEAVTLLQGNQMLRKGKHYDNRVIGVKTGYTSKAQNTLVAAAKEKNRTLIAVLFKCKDRDSSFRDARRLFDAAFSQTPVERVLLKEGRQSYALQLPGASKPVIARLNQNICADYYPAEEPKMKCMLYWDQLALPVLQGQRIGELHLMTDDDRLIKSVPVFAEEEVALSWPSRFKAFFASFFWGVFGRGGLIMAALFGVGFLLLRGAQRGR